MNCLMFGGIIVVTCLCAKHSCMHVSYLQQAHCSSCVSCICYSRSEYRLREQQVVFWFVGVTCWILFASVVY